MKLLVQTVTDASVEVENKVIGKIAEGLLVYIGFGAEDKENVIKPHVEKLLKLRIFPDKNERMNLSVRDVNKDLLLISQFTLYADVTKGCRPSFVKALKPEIAEEYYEKFITECRMAYPEGRIEVGKFGAMMRVKSANQGPTNFIVELS